MIKSLIRSTEGEVAVLVEPADVAGVQPAAVQDFGRPARRPPSRPRWAAAVRRCRACASRAQSWRRSRRSGVHRQRFKLSLRKRDLFRDNTPTLQFGKSRSQRSANTPNCIRPHCNSQGWIIRGDGSQDGF
jgi:hypothetical protein